MREVTAAVTNEGQGAGVSERGRSEELKITEKKWVMAQEYTKPKQEKY